jgi:aspartyl-tRNA(Asn)/glutamyl-tRNA(Gln) amidotransferase subunit C
MQEKHAQAVDRIDVAYVAHLARVQLTDTERDAFQKQLDQIVEYVRQIQEIDVEGVEPMAHAVAVENVFRDDAVRAGLTQEQALANAPQHSAGQFAVPKIVE